MHAVCCKRSWSSLSSRLELRKPARESILFDAKFPRSLKLERREIGNGRPAYIVAELSANHRQDFDQAVRIIQAAKDAGAEAVKLQTYTADTITLRSDK